MRPAARTALEEFVALVRRLRGPGDRRGRRRTAARSRRAIRYDEHLKAEGPEGVERLDNVREMVEGAAEVVADEGGEVGLTPLDHFLQKATLVTGVDTLDADADAVTMMTMHNAKGLEFPLVFIAGLEDGLFPLARAAEDPQAAGGGASTVLRRHHARGAEARTSRCAEQRRRNGEMMFSMPSSFLRAITASLAERRSRHGCALRAARDASCRAAASR